MKKYLKTDEWNIIEDQFHPDRQRMSESIFSLGNGRFGQRGYFEEPYSSDSYRGSFVAGITFLDKTRVGWWKNGFPPYYTRYTQGCRLEPHQPCASSMRNSIWQAGMSTASTGPPWI